MPDDKVMPLKPCPICNAPAQEDRDYLGLEGAQKKAFESLKKDGELDHISWASFLAKTRKSHESFIKEADRQRKLAVGRDAR